MLVKSWPTNGEKSLHHLCVLVHIAININKKDSYSIKQIVAHDSSSISAYTNISHCSQGRIINSIKCTVQYILNIKIYGKKFT